MGVIALHTIAAPTTKENISQRLFLRYFLCYLIGALLCITPASRGLLREHLQDVGIFSFCMIPLALLAGLLTLTKPYLMALTLVKAIFDTTLLVGITARIGSEGMNVLRWNGCFFLTAFSLILFCIAAARACLFSFENRMRDAALLCSRPFWRYCAEALLLIALALSLYFLWPQLLGALCVSP